MSNFQIHYLLFFRINRSRKINIINNEIHFSFESLACLTVITLRSKKNRDSDRKKSEYHLYIVCVNVKLENKIWWYFLHGVTNNNFLKKRKWQ